MQDDTKGPMVPYHQNITIQAELKSLVDPASSVQADVVQKGVGSTTSPAPLVSGVDMI